MARHEIEQDDRKDATKADHKLITCDKTKPHASQLKTWEE